MLGGNKREYGSTIVGEPEPKYRVQPDVLGLYTLFAYLRSSFSYGRDEHTASSQVSHPPRSALKDELCTLTGQTG